jgi:prevent-host-death family protein
MKTVSACDANQAFSTLLSQVENGEEIVITRRGRPVAVLAPYRLPVMTPERQKLLRL